MKKKIIFVVLIWYASLFFMGFLTYRYVMEHIEIAIDNDKIYLTVFDQTDVYNYD